MGKIIKPSSSASLMIKVLTPILARGFNGGNYPVNVKGFFDWQI
jgi:hypothetical protein